MQYMIRIYRRLFGMADAKPKQNLIADTQINGFLGYFFENHFFRNLVCMNTGNHTGGNLKIDHISNPHFELEKKNIASARWIGRIRPEKDGEYHFSTVCKEKGISKIADGSVVFLLIDIKNPNEPVYLPSIYMGKQRGVSLKKDTYYDAILEYNPLQPFQLHDIDLQVNWIPPGQTEPIIIPEQCVWFPDLTKPIIGRYLDSIEDTFFNYEPFEKLFQHDASQFYMPVRHCSPGDKCYCDKHPRSEGCINGEKKPNDPKGKKEPPIDCEKDRNNPKCKKNPPIDPKDLDTKNPHASHADTDDDGIINKWETEGFTIDRSGHIVPWKPEWENPQYNVKKYVSNPFKINTAGDPYTDLQKAMGDMNVLGGIDSTARHPFVAACPSIRVFMEGYLITESKEDTWDTKTKTGTHTKSGLEESNEEGTSTSTVVNLELGLNNAPRDPSKKTAKQLKGSASVSSTLTKKYLSSRNTISSTSNTRGEHNSQSTTYQTDKGGYLTAKVRYKNTGTAPINDLAPTMHFALWNKKDRKWNSVSTIKAPPSITANILGPKQSYPAGDLPLSITPGDKFSSTFQALTKHQVEEVLDGAPIRLEIPQIAGTFKGAGGKDLPEKGKTYQWSKYITNIEDSTARLSLELPGEVLERWVAAPSEKELSSKYPVQLTIGEAIDIAFGTTKYPDGSSSYGGYSLNRSKVNVFFDRPTEELIQQQLMELQKTKKDVTIYDVKLKREMVLVIKPVLDVEAFLFGNYVYIKNSTGESWFYSISRKNLLNKGEVARGIIASNATMGTGYMCENEDDELYISIGKEIDTETKVIFSGKVSTLKDFIPFSSNMTLHGQTLGLQMIFLQASSEPTENKVTAYLQSWDTSWNWQDLDLSSSAWTPGWKIEIKVDGKAMPPCWMPTLINAFMDKRIRLVAEGISTGKITDIPINEKGNTKIEIIGTPVQAYYKRNPRPNGVGILHEDKRYYYSSSIYRGMQKTFTVSNNKAIGIKPSTSLVGLYQSPEGHCAPNSLEKAHCSGGCHISPNNLKNVAKRPEASLQVFNKQSKAVTCKVNQAKSLQIPSMSSISIPINSFGGEYKDVKHFDTITVNDIPVYTGLNPELNIVGIKGVKKAIAGCSLQIKYWHMNTTDTSYTYDRVAFKELSLDCLNVFHSFEVKLNNNSIGKAPVRPPELDNHMLINFFDYSRDASQHPKQNDDITIIAHDILGGQKAVYEGKVGLSQEVWNQQYKVSEWCRFDAVYLEAVPTDITDLIRSYDIKVGPNTVESVSLERQENRNYLSTQRLKIDLTKYPAIQKLLQSGEKLSLILHPITDKLSSVTINLGETKESQKPDSINKIEEAHRITKWGTDGKHYTSMFFQSKSDKEQIPEYSIKINNQYIGKVANEGKDVLDLSKLKKAVTKGDYIQLYAYKKDGEAVLLQSRYVGTIGKLGEYPTPDTIHQALTITEWKKTEDYYTSLIFGNLTDPIQSDIKDYEILINEKPIQYTETTPNTVTFPEGVKVRHGDRLTLSIHTYHQNEAPIYMQQLAGAVGLVKKEDILSIHELKAWENQNETLAFDTGKLKDSIQAHIKSYTIEVGKPPYTKWEPFGKPILLTGDGKLHLKDCGAQPLPSHANRDIIRVTANLFNGEAIVVLDAQPIGLTNKLTTDRIKTDHEKPMFHFNEKGVCNGFTFKGVKEELESYIKNYQVQIWSQIPQTISPGSPQYQFSNEKGVSISFKPDKLEIKKTEDQDQITITVHLVTGLSVQLYSAVPTKLVSTEEIKVAHQIENWIYDYNETHVSVFYFNQKIEPYLKHIQYYGIKINGGKVRKDCKDCKDCRDCKDCKDCKELPPKDYVKTQTLRIDEEEVHKGIKGLAIRLEWFGFTGGDKNPFPQPGDRLDVIAHLKDHSTLEVIQNYKIPSKA